MNSTSYRAWSKLFRSYVSASMRGYLLEIHHIFRNFFHSPLLSLIVEWLFFAHNFLLGDCMFESGLLVFFGIFGNLPWFGHSNLWLQLSCTISHYLHKCTYIFPIYGLLKNQRFSCSPFWKDCNPTLSYQSVWIQQYYRVWDFRRLSQTSSYVYTSIVGFSINAENFQTALFSGCKGRWARIREGTLCHICFLFCRHWWFS